MRVLVLEDDAWTAFDVTDMLERAGFEPVGPAMSLAEGLRLVKAGALDAAILDIDLGPEADSFGLARHLDAAGKPVIFLSSFTAEQRASPPDLAHLPRLTKPYERFDVMEALASLA